MKNYIKSSSKVLFDYFVSLIVFVILIYVFLSITKDKFNQLLPFYCMFMFVIAFFIIYSDMKGLALKEKKPQYELKPYPLKGFIYGLIGFIPIILLEVLSVVIQFKDQSANHLKHIFINILMGPPYFIIRYLGERPLGYILATLVIPIVAMLGYMAGYYGFKIGTVFGKKDVKPVEKSFTKSPWNPTNKVSGTKTKTKKKKPKTTGGI